MNLYLMEPKYEISLDCPHFELCVVCASNARLASLIHPSEDYVDWDGRRETTNQWVGADDLNIISLGEALPSVPEGIVFAFFRA